MQTVDLTLDIDAGGNAGCGLGSLSVRDFQPGVLVPWGLPLAVARRYMVILSSSTDLNKTEFKI